MTAARRIEAWALMTSANDGRPFAEALDAGLDALATKAAQQQRRVASKPRAKVIAGAMFTDDDVFVVVSALTMPK